MSYVQVTFQQKRHELFTIRKKKKDCSSKSQTWLSYHDSHEAPYAVLAELKGFIFLLLECFTRYLCKLELCSRPQRLLENKPKYLGYHICEKWKMSHVTLLFVPTDDRKYLRVMVDTKSIKGKCCMEEACGTSKYFKEM